MNRGEIHIVDLGSIELAGYCVGGKHPCLVLKKIDNYKALVIPFTSQKVDKIHRTEIVFEQGESNLLRKSKLQCTQFQNVSVDKIKKYIGIVPKEKLNVIDSIFSKVIFQ